MARGGIYDQLGGGFSRYSVDMIWKVPHFEKMLYDNGQLLSLYAQAYRYDPQPEYKWVLDSTLGWLNVKCRRRRWFIAAQDADSEGVEGKYYVWTPEEIKAILGSDAKWYLELYNPHNKGYWEQDNGFYYVIPRGKNSVRHIRKLQSRKFKHVMNYCLPNASAALLPQPIPNV